MTSKTLILLLVISSLLAAALLTRIADLAWMALPFLAYFGLGIIQSPSTAKIQLRAERTLEISRADAVSTIQVQVSLTNLGKSIDQISLSDPLQVGMVLTGEPLKQTAALGSREMTTLKYTFRAERGRFKWDTVQVVVSDPFSLVESRLEVAAAAEVRVQPDLKKYRPFPLRSQRTLHSAGSIPARIGGSGTDFWGVREYQPGDPLRRLDWRLTARHPHKFYTKEFEQEEIADIGLILDARRKTNLWVGNESLFEHSARATASLAEVFLRQGNRVSLLVFGEPKISLYPGYGKVQLNRILRTLAQVTTESDESFESLQLLPIQMFSSHSLILIVSPLAYNDWLLFPRLRAYGYQVLLVSPDPIDYAQSVLEKDQITGLASRLAGLERRQEIAKIIQLWIPVIDWQVNQPLAPLVRNALSRPHILREH
jgi:uncharacterized protein (DUF58 family)